MSIKSKLFGKAARPDPTSRFLETLKALGLAPGHIVDIGANRGDWTRKASAIFPGANFTMFEPQEALSVHHYDLAAKPSVDIVYAGVGDRDGLASFTIHCRDDSSSFSYSKQQAREGGYQQEEVRLHRLDSFMKNHHFGAPEIVKIDAEGFDLEVIDGAKETLNTADVVFLEASVSNPQYRNSVLFVFQRMSDLGFKLFDITDLNRAPKYGALWLVELVFVRQSGEIASKAATYA